MTIQKDLSVTVKLPVTSKAAYDAISRVNEWWMQNFEGRAREVGDRFTVRLGETKVDFEVTEAEPSKWFVWRVEDSFLPWLQNKMEWNGTQVDWKLVEEDGATTVHMIHKGLTPEVECYENCESGWQHYVTKSLYHLVTEGKGIFKEPSSHRR